MRKLIFFLLLTIAGCGTTKPPPPTQVAVIAPTTLPANPTKNEKIAKKLRFIGIEILIYLDNHDGKLPQDLGELGVKATDSPKQYVLPEAEASVPTSWQKMTPDDRRDWINKNSAFAYIGQGLGFTNKYSLPPDKIVIAYEKGGNAAEGISLLYFDLHVEFDPWNVATQRLKETRAFLQTIQAK